MTYRTADRAHEMLCLFARTFIRVGQVTAADAGCIGPKCALWRWQTTETWRKAVAAVAKEIDEAPTSSKAAAIVAKDPVKYGCEGMCGAGGAR